MSNVIAQLAADWMEAKRVEEESIRVRREIEDQISQLLNVSPALEGTSKFEVDGYDIRIIGRIDRKVDADLVQEVAAEHGLTGHLSYLFRWKPEVNAAQWKSADESITGPLLAAITARPGRPSFKITQQTDYAEEAN